MDEISLENTYVLDPFPSTPSSSTDATSFQSDQTTGSSSSKRKRNGTEDSSLSSGSSFKKPKRAAPPEGVLQAASYALEILSNTNGSRVHCLGMVLWRAQLSLWYYDASGVVTTSDELSVIQDFEKFAAIIVCLACCSPEQLGATPKICPPSGTPYPDHFPSKSMSGYTVDLSVICDDENAEATSTPASASTSASTSATTSSTGKPLFRVTLGSSIFAQYTLVGRHTIVYNAAVENVPACAPGTALVVKVSQQVHTRLKEYDLVNSARRAGVKNLPELHLAGDLWSPDEGLRGLFYEEDQANYEKHVLHALVYTKYEPLGALFSRSSRYLGEMVYQMLECESSPLPCKLLHMLMFHSS